MHVGLRLCDGAGLNQSWCGFRTAWKACERDSTCGVRIRQTWLRGARKISVGNARYEKRSNGLKPSSGQNTAFSTNDAGSTGD